MEDIWKEKMLMTMLNVDRDGGKLRKVGGDGGKVGVGMEGRLGEMEGR